MWSCRWRFPHVPNEGEERNRDKKNFPPCGGKSPLKAGETIVDRAERISNGRAEEHESGNYNNGNQDKYESILNQSLAFFSALGLHADHLLSWGI
jgi:hypothetical protein